MVYAYVTPSSALLNRLKEITKPIKISTVIILSAAEIANCPFANPLGLKRLYERVARVVIA